MFEDVTNWLIAGGLVLGAIFGLITRQNRVCLVGAVSNVTLVKDYRYALLFAVAALFAITGTQLLEIYGIVDIGKASYRNVTLDWVGVIIGGLLFGVGATLAGGDAARIVILAGNGSHTGWIVVFFFAIFASVAQFGLLESIRVYSLLNTSIETPEGGAGLANLLSAPKWLILVIVDVLLVGFIIAKWKQHADLKLLVAGAVLGLTVVAAWYTTGVLAVDEFAEVKPPSAMTVSGPMSRTGIMLVAGQYPAFSFSVSFVIALLAISFITALITKQFHFTPVQGSAGKIALGGALMGLGGTFAYGCNIGQGYSGLSTLSLESILAVVAMVIGIHVTTRYLEKKS